ncbi:MAG: secretin N-terminal domain-containing protein [Thermoguttaceae bacterium]
MLAVAAAVAAAIWAAPLRAADPELVGILALAAETEVSDEMGLTETQKAKLLELIDAREQEALELAVQWKDLSAKERTEKLAAFRKQSEADGLAQLRLSKQQLEILLRASARRKRPAAASEVQAGEKAQVRSGELSQPKDLPKPPQQGAGDAGDAARPAKVEPNPAGGTGLSQGKTSGESAKIAGLPAPPGGPGEPVAAAAGPPKQALGAGALKPPAEEAPAAKQVPPPGQPSKMPESAEEESEEPSEEELLYRAWLEGELPEMGEPAEPPGGAPAKAEPPKPPSAPVEPLKKKPAERLKFSFRTQPWKDVLEWFADQCGLSLYGDPPLGTFNYTDSREYTPAEAIDLLNRVLLTKGYTLVRHEQMLQIVNLEDLKDGIPQKLVKTVPPEQLDKCGEYELVSTLFTLEKITVEEAEQEIRKLTGIPSSVIVLPKSRQIEVTDTGGRLRRIRDVLQALEHPTGMGANPVYTHELRTMDAQQAMTLLRQLMDIPADKTETADKSVRFAADPTGTKILITGKPDAMARALEIIKAMDAPDPANPDATRLGQTPQLEVYNVSPADPTTAYQVISTLLAGMPSVRLTTDPKTGNLVAWAPPAQHATIRATLEQMKRDAQRVEVIQLRSLDPQVAVAAITKLFAAEAGASAPKVDADPNTRQLVIRANEAQISQIRDFLAKMGETMTAEEGFGGGHVRVLPFSGRAARSALDRLQEIWPSFRQNRIRVVTPSASIPAIHPSGGVEAAQGSDNGTPRKPLSPDEQGALPEDMLRWLLQLQETPAVARPPARGASPNGQTRPQPSPPGSAGSGGQVPIPAPSSNATLRDKSAAAGQPDSSLGARVRLVADENSSGQSASAGKGPERAQVPSGSESRTGSPAAAAGSAKPSTSPKANPVPAQEPAPVVIIPGPSGVMIASDDLEALDQVERLLTTLVGMGYSGNDEVTIFYLKHAKAVAVAETLDEFFGGGTSGGGGGRSLLGNVAGAALNEMGAGMLGSLLGLGGEGGSARAPGAPLITPDSRLNALIVQAHPSDLDLMEQLLKVLDQPGSPEEVLAESKPRLIPVYWTQAQEIAEIVRQVYQDRLVSSAPGGGRPPSPQDIIQMLRGGRGGPGGRRRGSQEDLPRMSIGVDVRTNSLIVAAPDSLFQEVKMLVEELDFAASDTTEAVEVVTLQRTSPQAVQQALSAMLGQSIQVAGSASRGGPGARGGPGGPFGGFPGGPGGQPQPPMGPFGGGMMPMPFGVIPGLQQGALPGSSGFRSRFGGSTGGMPFPSRGGSSGFSPRSGGGPGGFTPMSPGTSAPSGSFRSRGSSRSSSTIPSGGSRSGGSRSGRGSGR